MEEFKNSRSRDEAIGDMFSNLLCSMGIENYDLLLLAALNEIASRFAAELLTDAKDYALHSSREFISAEDINIAAKLCESSGMHDGTQSLISDMKDKINKKPLADMLKKDSIKIKYLSTLLQRPVTIIAGNDAYGSVAEFQKNNTEISTEVTISEGPSLVVEKSSSLLGVKRVALQMPEGGVKKKLLTAAGFES